MAGERGAEDQLGEQEIALLNECSSMLQRTEELTQAALLSKQRTFKRLSMKRFDKILKAGRSYELNGGHRIFRPSGTFSQERAPVRLVSFLQRRLRDEMRRDETFERMSSWQAFVALLCRKSSRPDGVGAKFPGEFFDHENFEQLMQVFLEANSYAVEALHGGVTNSGPEGWAHPKNKLGELYALEAKCPHESFHNKGTKQRTGMAKEGNSIVPAIGHIRETSGLWFKPQRVGLIFLSLWGFTSSAQKEAKRICDDPSEEQLCLWSAEQKFSEWDQALPPESRYEIFERLVMRDFLLPSDMPLKG
jgi:hypothetical protein